MSGTSGHLPVVRDLSVATHPCHADARGALWPLELSRAVDFAPVRLFWVAQVPNGQSRGGHAHKGCSQYMICQSGSIDVEVHDGAETAAFGLQPGQALLIPPGLWASERYNGTDAMLLVLCDRPYDRDDYIASMEEFLSYRRDFAT